MRFCPPTALSEIFMHFGDKKSKVVTPRTDASEKLFGLVTTVIGGKGAMWELVPDACNST